MSSLFGGISIALSSMMAQQSSIDVTANNVSNINTPGYTRERVDLVERVISSSSSPPRGGGVDVQQVTSLRDRVLELRIQSEAQQQGSLQAQVNALSDVQTLFSTDTSNLGDAINDFFNSLSNLSTNPSDSSLRQSVLVSAGNLANSFRSTSGTLQQRQFDLDLQVQQTVDEINQTTAQIAAVNQSIAAQPGDAATAGSLEDQRDVLLENLSNLIGNHVIASDDHNGISVTTTDGTALVVGSNAVPLTVNKDADGNLHVWSGQKDLTDTITGGELAGLIQVRNQTIPSLLSNLDTLASSLITSFNNAHTAGFDLNGDPGEDFFVPPPASGQGAAGSFALNITDPSQIAASSDATAAGSNGNLSALTTIASQTVVDGDTPTDYYSKIAFTVGSQLADAQSNLNASEQVSQQLQDQRGAISGVSLDEEAANLIRFQRAYEAAARVLDVINQLTEVSVNIGSS